MDAKQLQQIKNKLKERTWGEWVAGYDAGSHWIYSDTGSVIAELGGGLSFIMNEANATFIVQAVKTIPALVAEVERLQAALEERQADFNKCVACDGIFGTVENSLCPGCAKTILQERDDAQAEAEELKEKIKLFILEGDFKYHIERENELRKIVGIEEMVYDGWDYTGTIHEGE